MRETRSGFSKRKSIAPSENGDFESLVVSIVHIHQQAQEFATKAVNVGLTLRNWLIGRQIEIYERQGADRATYGDKFRHPDLSRWLERPRGKRWDQFLRDIPRRGSIVQPRVAKLPWVSDGERIYPERVVSKRKGKDARAFCFDLISEGR